MARIGLAVIDDHRIVRDGLKALLKQYARFVVVAEGNNGNDAVRLAQNSDIDVFLLDLAMPVLNGIAATERIIAVRPDAGIIILSMHAGSDFVANALAAGARGYIVKNLAPEELHQAVVRVAGGGIYVSPSSGYSRQPQNNGTGSADVRRLTARQREILVAVANGRSTRQIADALSISTKTVESHRSQLMQKLGIHDVPGLVKFAIRHGLISVD